MTGLAAAAFGLGLGSISVLADTVSTGGPDLIGVAAVITAVSGLIATVGMLYLNLRRGRDVIREDIARAVKDGLKQGGRDET